MIKEVFKLRKNSWHARLMRWCLGFKHDNFRNMCPYFWLTVMNIIIVGPLTILKLIFMLFKALGSYFDALAEEREKRWMESVRNSIIEGTDDDIFYEAMSAYTVSGDYKNMRIKRRLQYDKILSDIFGYDNLEEVRKVRVEYFAKFDQMRSKRMQLQEEKEQRMKERNQRLKCRKEKIGKSSQQIIGELTVKVKKVAKIIGALVIAGLCYILYRVVMWMIGLNWYYIGDCALDLLLRSVLIFCCISAIYVLVDGTIKVVSAIVNFCIGCDRRKQALKSALRKITVVPAGYIILPIAKLGCYIWRGISAFWYLLMAIKSNNCPGIEWED